MHELAGPAALWIVAHRGWTQAADENSLAAFQAGWDQGVDAVEGDFRLTRDRQIVCIHDATTERLWKVKHTVAESTLAELKDAQRRAAAGMAPCSQPPATLAEVLDLVPAGKKIFLELKTGPEIVPPLQIVLRSSRLSWDQIILIGFEAETVRAAKTLLPELRAHLLMKARSLALGEDTQQEFIGAAEMLDALRASGADGLGLEANVDWATGKLLHQLRQGGLREFHVWTVNSPRAARHFADLGPLAITTDFPGQLREWIS